MSLKEVNFFDSKYKNLELHELEISKEIFVDEDCDYNSNYSDFDTILWLPTAEAIKQTPRGQNITGIALCVKNLSLANDIIDKDFKDIDSNELFMGSFKKMSDETKVIIAKTIKKLSMNGFILSVSIPSYLFDSSNEKRKVSSLNYAIINSLLKKIFDVKSNANIQNINIYVISRGIANNGLDSRISRLAKKVLTSEIVVNKNYLDIENNYKNKILDRILGVSCWFINQKEDPVNAKWLSSIK
ncbi:hypothetical protein C0W59_19280 [Photobacterium kishitanii]|uniref:hypothetical protein n=1 Tax=Photobacterium kishitanii TaxID=318456 RepID=UPI000D17BC40|nr:hypothetical protein [Photobacterium kishitanii]PSV11675.1 hypothetical protein C0W59_19280 [Photobacterium kishitanii]